MASSSNNKKAYPQIRLPVVALHLWIRFLVCIFSE